MIGAGIDAGSRSIKIVLVDGDTGGRLACGITDQGVRQQELASQLLDGVMSKAGLGRREVGGTVATGYGRDAIEFADTTITEITCHAAGVHSSMADARTVIDIGGQDSKVMRLEVDGRVRDFAMNDRCAAGTGRFLEIVAKRLELSLEALGETAARAMKPAAISSMCAVFAETEIVGLLASGESPANIVAGVQAAIAARVAALAGQHLHEPVAFTGGVALIPGMRPALESALGHPVRIAHDPQYTGALGAALLACRKA